MEKDKVYLRKKYLLIRKKKYFKIGNVNFNLIFRLIIKNFNNKKIIIGGYYPSFYEVDTLSFFKKASEKKFKIALPLVKSATAMRFKSWNYKEPLNVSKFGTLEPSQNNKEVTPDLIMVPLVTYDNKLNRIGYGKGYYDRSLKKIKKINKKVISLGIAYSFQEYKKIPINKYDFKLDYIFTEQGIISSN